MKNGRVTEHGTHEEVYRADGAYKEIFDAAARSLNVEKINDTLESDD
jgi:ABC-type transport system involved in cytochrome bd biosynthesis fused ATPase/permease subunit